MSSPRFQPAGRDSRWPDRVTVLAYIAAATSFVLGAMGLVGWALGLPALKSLWSEGLVTKTNSAIGTMLLGAAILLLLPRQKSIMRQRIATGIAVVVLLLGIVSLFEIITGANLGVDELLFQEDMRSRATASPNRMGPPAAMAFLFGGMAVLLLNYRLDERFRPAEALGIFVLVAGMFPFVGYLYGASELYGLAGFTNTAFQTAIGIALLGVAILLSRPEYGLMSVVTQSGTAGSIVRRLLLPIILFPLLVGWVQVRVLRANAIEFQFVAVLGTLLVVSFLVALLTGFGKRLGVAELDQEAADENVRQARERLSMALVGAESGAWEWDVAADRITWSNESRLLFGERALPVDRAGMLALMDPADRQAVTEELQDALHRGDALDSQFRMVGNGTETRWFRSIGRVTRDESGSPVRITGILRDITSDKLNEIRLRRTALRLELLYNTTLAVLGTEDAQQAAKSICERVLTHLDCEVVLNYVRSGADQLKLYSWAGITEEQASTWSVMPIDSIISGTVVREGVRIVVEDIPTQPRDPRYDLIRDLGLLAYACHPLITEGKPVGTIAFGSRTVRRFTLETLALMQAVANHVALAIQRSHASRELAQARAWQERFLAALSHELRMPLTPILVSAQMLEDETGYRDSAREQLAMIHRNVELEARLIDDLLDMTRVNNGKLPMRLESVSLHNVLRVVTEACSAEVREKQIILTTDLVAEHDTVLADANRLQKAIWNVVRNAVTFTPVKGTITIRTENPDAGTVTTRVQDTGIGMAEDAVATVFEPFERTADSSENVGLGVGLSISRGLVELHGGTVRASSPGIGHGSTFEIVLPLTTRAAVAHEPPPADLATKARVLVVDDHVDTGRAIQRLMAHLGNDVQLAGSVAEAMDLARINSFDLLISDISLTDGTGIELLQKLQEIQPLRAIAISGHAMEEDIDRSLRGGFCAHLTKPVSIDQLRTAMADAMRQPSVAPKVAT